MASIEEDIFTSLNTAYADQLSWVDTINTETPVLNIDQLQNNEFPYISVFWDKPSVQQPLRGKTETNASFVVQIFDKQTSKRSVSQYTMFSQREDVKNATMGEGLRLSKVTNQSFIQFSYTGRIYDVHSMPGIFLTEVYFNARYNEQYGDC